MDNIKMDALSPDDALRWGLICKRVLDIIYSPVAPTPVESDLVWLAQRFRDAQPGKCVTSEGDSR